MASISALQESHDQTTNSQNDRKYYYDDHSRVQREIWRPGDGDGDPDAEYYIRNGPQPPPDKRWRFFQLSHRYGINKNNLPPRYVILDDRACWEIIQSDIPKTHRAGCWSHDFSGQGRIRSRRPHRGRGVKKKFSQVEEDDSEDDGNGESEFAWTWVGSGEKRKYYLTGESGYEAVDFPSPDHDTEWLTEVNDETSCSPKQQNNNMISQQDSPTKKQRLKDSGTLAMADHQSTQASCSNHSAIPAGTLMTGIFFSQPESLRSRTKPVEAGYFETLNKKIEPCTIGEHEKLVAQVAELKLTLANAVERIELLEEYFEKNL